MPCCSSSFSIRFTVIAILWRSSCIDLQLSAGRQWTASSLSSSAASAARAAASQVQFSTTTSLHGSENSFFTAFFCGFQESGFQYLYLSNVEMLWKRHLHLQRSLDDHSVVGHGSSFLSKARRSFWSQFTDQFYPLGVIFTIWIYIDPLPLHHLRIRIFALGVSVLYLASMPVVVVVGDSGLCAIPGVNNCGQTSCTLDSSLAV